MRAKFGRGAVRRPPHGQWSEARVRTNAVTKLRWYTDPSHPLGWGGSECFLAESQSGLYRHMLAKFGRDPTAGSKKVSFKFIIGCIVLQFAEYINDYLE